MLRRHLFHVNFGEPMTRKPRWQQEDPRFGEESARYAKPIPSRELLLAKLRDAQRPLAFDAIAATLAIRDPGERQALEKRLGAMRATASCSSTARTSTAWSTACRSSSAR